ncbi:MAG: flagellar hook-basal body complex protein [Peptococcaceae bacterium]|nr:flagellar hook-basal body complex protein [Peptococcaceae bacterium]
MIRSLYSGVSGIRNHQVRMDTLSNNIANVNTTGFKTARANFQDSLNQVLRGGGGSRNPMQAGTGLSTGSIGTNMGQGTLQMTGRTLDLAIQGTGFFRVTDGTSHYYTRDGAFFIDNDGNIVNSMGLQLEDSTGPLQFNAGFDPSSITIDKTGLISYTDGGGPQTLQIEIFTFPNPEGLLKAGNSLYEEDPNVSGAAATHTPGTGAGTVESGYLEMSNTDLSEEFTTMITTQRGYQASARIITVSDTLLEELIQLKR